jgi:RNA polymerase sigma factor (sigma-70 family)
MENINQYSDEKLVKLFCAGRQEAGGELVQRYQPLVCRLCSPVFVRTFAEDLKQSLWVRFFEAVRIYDEKKGVRFSGYIQSILAYERWNQFKSCSRKWDHEAEYPESWSEPSSAEDPSALTDAALAALIRRLPLPSRQKEILLLMAQGYHTSAEMARCLHISTQAVHMTRRRLRENCLRLRESGMFL